MALPVTAQASLDEIFRSGKYVRRPHRQIFVEHQMFNAQGQVSRKATKQDLIEIANTGNQKALTTGDLSRIGFGHTLEPIRDESGNIVRRFSEEEQPVPRGFLHNYTVEQLPDGRWALFADEWIQKVMQNEKGELVDGLQYATTFPHRSPEYFPQKKWIDWLALLRTTPALDMGLDIVQYAALFPGRVHYGDARHREIAAIEDSEGKWRYAARYSEGNTMDDDTPTDSKPSETPADPPDDRPPIPAETTPPQQSQTDGSPDGGLHELHKKAAEQYSMHTLGMHHSHSAALMHHMHSMYGAQLGLNPDKHTPYMSPMPGAPTTPQAPPTPAAPVPAAAAPGGAAAPTPPHQQNSPVGLSGDSSWQHGGTPPGPGPTAQPHQHNNAPAAATGPGVPGGGNAFIPGEAERRTMHSIDQNITNQQAAAQVQQHVQYAQQLEARLATLEFEKRKADHKAALITLRAEKGLRFDLAKEFDRAAKWKYAEDRCKEQMEFLEEHCQTPDRGEQPQLLLYDHAGTPVDPLQPRSAIPGEPEGVSRELAQKALTYSRKHSVTFDEAVAKIKAGAA